MKYLAALLMFFCFGAQAEGEWTPTQKALAATYFTLLAADRGQTLDTSPRFRETNPVLGSRPSRGRVNLYFGAVALGSAIGLELASTEIRTGALVFLTTVEVCAVGHNAAIGVHMRF